MKAVSNAYKNSMKAILRNRSYVRVLFSNVDSEAAKDGVWENNGAVPFSTADTLDYTYDYGPTYATLELNRWALDSGTILVPESGTMRDGFISDHLSDGDGVFQEAAVLTRQFATPHTFPGLTLTFDTRQKEWPLSVTAEFSYQGQVVTTAELTATGTTAALDARVPLCDMIRLTFGAGLPYRRPRLEEVLYGVKITFENADLVSTKQSHDVDPLSRRLPQESMNFTILDYEHNYDPDKPSGIYAYVDKNAPVTIQFGYELPDGTVEWLKPDKYLLNGKPTAKNNQATFTGTGLIGSLSGTFYKSKLGQKNFYDMAEEVLLDAGLTPTPAGEHPWVIDESLKTMFTTAVLPIDTHMNCLQLIAHACRCRLFTDDDNIIHIKPFGVTVVGIYSGVWADNGHLWYSEWDTVDRGNTFGSTYTTLELNRWTLDGGNQVLIPEDDPSKTGYIGSALSGSEGTWEVAPVFSKTFDVSHDLPVVALRFDMPLNEFPSAIQVRYYAGDTLLDTQTMRGIEGPEIMVSSNLAFDCTRIEVTALSALPFYRLRVSKVYYRETDFTLDFTTIGEKSQSVSKIDQLKAVSVAKYVYTPDGDTQTLFDGTTGNTVLHVEFSGIAEDVAISVSGGTLEASTIYAQAADLTLSAGTKSVVITGKPLKESSMVVTYPVAVEGEIDKEENPLITSDEMCAALATQVMRYLQMRNTYDASYRGNPEMEVGDIIGLQTSYTPEMDALVLVDEITFNGSLSGKMKVKGLI